MDPFDEAVRSDPYPVYAELRTREPVHRLSRSGERSVWLVTRYGDVDRALRDPALSKNARRVLPRDQLPQLPDAVRPLFKHMLLSDPPHHTRLRSLVSRAFTPRLVEAQRDRVHQIAGQLVDAVEDDGAMDLVDQYAFPLPMRVITHFLGVPGSDADRFRQWSQVVVDAPAALGMPPSAQLLDVLAEFRAYLLDLFDRKRRDPADDLVSALVLAEDVDGTLSEDELVAMVFLLLIAGHETTVGLIGNSVLALLRHPDQLALVRDQPALLDGAIEELLRYDGPVATATVRYALDDLDLAGTRVRAGDTVLLSLASADRDGDRFPAADRLDVRRPDNRHVAFGRGIHYCLGAPLARLEGTVAIGTLVRRLPGLRLTVPVDALEHRPGAIVRGLTSLPIAW